MSVSGSAHLLRWWVIFVALAAPLLQLAWRIASNDLGPEPAKTLAIALGESTLIILLCTLAISPLRTLTGKSYWLRYRRMVGLWCLAYALLHASAYWLLLADWADILEDLLSRPYIFVGALALLGLILLGVTSPKFMVRKLGRRWKSLHRLIYVVLVLALMHVWWQVRSDYGEVLMFTVLSIFLMFFRRAWLVSLFKGFVPLKG